MVCGNENLSRLLLTRPGPPYYNTFLTIQVQAGKQLEWLTGGVVQAGYHEVIVNEATARVIANKTNDRPLWRISSTLFLHIASDNILRPLEGVFDTEELRLAKYPKIHTGDQVRKELGLIALLEK